MLTALGTLVLVVGLVWGMGFLPDLVRLLPNEFQSSFEKTSTLTAREDIWAYALGSIYANWDIARQFFGPPAGEQLQVVFGGQYWQYSLHSQ